MVAVHPLNINPQKKENQVGIKSPNTCDNTKPIKRLDTFRYKLQNSKEKFKNVILDCWNKEYVIMVTE